MAEKARCAVVGAANIDIGGFPLGRLSLRDSNPGRITLSAGGVGRNIACNLARLGVETRLIAALGTDAFADLIRGDPEFKADDCRSQRVLHVEQARHGQADGRKQFVGIPAAELSGQYLFLRAAF